MSPRTPLDLDPAQLRQSLNDDPEFRLQARYWNTTFRIVVEGRALLVRIIDGVIVEVDTGATPFDAWNFQLAGTAEQWAQLLAPVPVAFYQDYYAAMLYHGFAIEGDMQQIMAYYPAIRRSLDVLRTLATKEITA